MTPHFDDWDGERQKIIGFGPQSLRKNYYQELRSNVSHLQRFRALLNQNSEGIVIIEADNGKIIELNRATCDLVGCQPEDLLETTFDRIIPEISGIWHRAGDQIHWIQMVTLNPLAGSPFQVEMTTQFTRFQGHGFYLITLRDVRELLQSLHEVQEIRSNLEAVFDHSMDPIIVHSYDAKIIAINERAALLFGMTKENATSVTIPDITTGDGTEKDRFGEIIDQITTKGETIFEWVGKNVATGEPLDIEVLLRPCTWFGKPAIIAFVRDIRERKSAESDRKKIEEQFHQAQKMESIGRLAGGIAHDFNNLLTIILGYTELLLMQSTGTDPSKFECLNEMLAAGNSAKKLTQQLLAFSRKQEIQLNPVSIYDILNNFSKILARTLRENIQVKFDGNSDVPPILADSGQIEQVILNLAVNAQDAMPAGGLLLIRLDKVYIHRRTNPLLPDIADGEYVRLGVIDSGEGMSKETQQHIFEPFFTTKESGKGTGLGLATVYGIVKQHGGFIQVYSELGMGTSFHVYFPVMQEATRVVHPDESNLVINGEGTILLVEDNVFVRQATEILLKRLGYTVIATDQQDQCLDIIRANPVDLILSDVIMPGMNGPVLVQMIHEVFPDIPVLFMSGYTSDLLPPELLDTESITLLLKPFDLKTLSQHVFRALHTR